ncbi:MAG: hypothetical protein PF505_09090 [Vallitaleaceae bacterium]|jgi:hypothetical protein|nr:hypothetical protein [Vallitaleaceae bacterium]
MNFFNPYGPFVEYGTKLFNVLFCNIVVAFVIFIAINALDLSASLSSLPFLVFSFFITLLILGISLVGIFKAAFGGIAPHYGFGPAYFIRPFKQLKTRWRLLIIGSFLNVFLIATSLYAVILILTGTLDLPFIMTPVYVLLFLESLIVSFYSFPLMAHTEMSFMDTFKYAFGFAHRHFLVTLASVAITAAAIYMVIYYWMLIFIVPSLAIASISYLVLTFVFPKYELEKFGLDLESYVVKKS